MPCYALIDKQGSAILQKISKLVTASVQSTANYLNDFIFFTDEGFSTDWHIDTELFCFKNAVNAWILLYPDQIANPLAFIDGFNGNEGERFHSIQNEGDSIYMVNYSTNDLREFTYEEIDQITIGTPKVECGDMLLLDPRYFHKTNTTLAKSACAIKFILGNHADWMSDDQVPGVLWPEVDVYNDIVNSAVNWTDVLREIRARVTDCDLSSPLLAGFYPEKFKYLRSRIESFL